MERYFTYQSEDYFWTEKYETVLFYLQITKLALDGERCFTYHPED